MLSLLCLPLLQQTFKIVDVKPLSGAYNLPDTSALNSKNWFAGDFQNKYSPFYEYQIGFRPFFVRLRNQLYVWTYGKSDGYVVIGKEGQLFAWNYWYSSLNGGDFIGDEEIAKRVGLMSDLQEKLKEQNTPLLVIIGPNKVRHLPEYLPDNYNKEQSPTGNYNSWRKALVQSDLNVIDYNQIYIDLKKEYGRSIFPNTGTHWSAAGMGLALEAILNAADRAHGDSIMDVSVDNLVLMDSIVDSDVDLRNDLNIFFPPDIQPNLFPEISIKQNGRKAKVLVIGDSFYWNLFQLPSFHETIDTASHFFYYNNTDKRLTWTETPVEGLDIHKIVENVDIVVLLATEANLHKLPYGFPENYLGKPD